jgi:hypothetical protein
MGLIRGKVLFISLISVGCVAAVLGILQMWTSMMDVVIFGKIMVTLLVVGILSSFLMAVDYDLPGSRTKIMLGVLVALALVATLLILLQIWFSLLAYHIFWKAAVTLIILAGLVAFILAAHEDFGTNKKLKDDNFID